VVLKLIAIKGRNWVLGIDTLLIVSIPYDSGIDTYRYRKLGKVISAKPVHNTSCPKFKFASFLNYNLGGGRPPPREVVGPKNYIARLPDLGSSSDAAIAILVLASVIANEGWEGLFQLVGKGSSHPLGDSFRMQFHGHDSNSPSQSWYRVTAERFSILLAIAK
jgi:hypothetical protein